MMRFFWKEEYRKLKNYDLPVSHSWKEQRKIWQDQTLAICILLSKTFVCKDFYMVAIPVMFKNCFDVRKQRVCLAKYDKMLVEQAIATNDFSHFASQHENCKEYCRKHDVYMQELTIEIAHSLRKMQ